LITDLQIDDVRNERKPKILANYIEIEILFNKTIFIFDEVKKKTCKIY